MPPHKDPPQKIEKHPSLSLPEQIADPAGPDIDLMDFIPPRRVDPVRFTFDEEENAMTLLALDHIQLAMPAGGEDAARAFYSGLLGLAEVPKPENLARRGGVWFERGSIKVHLGVEADFRPARKAHPAFRVADLPALVARLKAAGVETVTDEPLPGYDRCYISDPFGNRIELLQPQG